MGMVHTSTSPLCRFTTCHRFVGFLQFLDLQLFGPGLISFKKRVNVYRLSIIRMEIPSAERNLTRTERIDVAMTVALTVTSNLSLRVW